MDSATTPSAAVALVNPITDTMTSPVLADRLARLLLKNLPAKNVQDLASAGSTLAAAVTRLSANEREYDWMPEKLTVLRDNMSALRDVLNAEIHAVDALAAATTEDQPG